MYRRFRRKLYCIVKITILFFSCAKFFLKFKVATRVTSETVATNPGTYIYENFQHGNHDFLIVIKRRRRLSMSAFSDFSDTLNSKKKIFF